MAGVTDRSKDIKELEESLRVLKESLSAQQDSTRDLISATSQNQESQILELKKLIVNFILSHRQSADPEQLSSSYQEEDDGSDNDRRTILEHLSLDVSSESLEGWISHCEQLFEINGTAADKKVEVAALHMEGEALQWHQAFLKKESPSWEEYLRVLRDHWGGNNRHEDQHASRVSRHTFIDDETNDPTFPPTWKYDVFISFRGDDTRRGFASHLFHALRDADINCYRDIDRDSRGQVVGPMLIDAIHHSMMCIILFSQNYADSKWCLQELVEILICHKQYRDYGHALLPIFYDVEPSEVRNQSGKVGKAFKSCRPKNKQQKEEWRKALEEAGNVSSWHLTNDANGDEAELIEEIIEQLLKRVFYSRSSYFVKSAIGTNDNVNYLISLLDIDGKDSNIRTIGIYGGEGIGKTALAKITCSHLYNTFEGSISLLENIHDNATPEGFLLLQSKLVKDVLDIKRASLSEDRSRNIGEIRKRLYQKKVFLVLDNIDNTQEMVSIFGRDPEKFLNCGSRILITTRNKQLLDELNVDGMYMVPPLHHQDSLNLFYYHALVEENYRIGYEEMSTNLVHYTGGLPLSVQTLGSFLSDKPKDEWHQMLQKLVRNINPRLDSIGVRLGSVSPLYNHRTVDPIGGSGDLFDDGRNTDVKKIKITVSSKNPTVVQSIQVEYDRNGSSILSCAHGGHLNPDKGTAKQFALDYPDEYLTSIKGTIAENVNFGAIQSITFHSNKSSYGPFGTEKGKSFTFPEVDGGKIIGFFGHCDSYFVDSIGAYFGPISDPSPFISNGPYGGGGSRQGDQIWDDGQHSDVRQMDIVVDDAVIKSIHITYDNYGHTTTINHGSNNGVADMQVKLDYPYEYLRSISGYIGETEPSSSDVCVRSLTFHSNKRTYGPFGDEVGLPFCTQPSGAKIVGLFGSWGSQLRSIGAHLEPVSHIHPRRVIEPNGSEQGRVWDHGENGTDIRKIVIALGDKGIASVSCEYDNNGVLIEEEDPTQYREATPRLFKQVKLNYPTEYINSMSGSYVQSSNGMTILKSLTFETNVATYGPYGLSRTTKKETCFKTPWNMGKIVGFYGTKNLLGGDYVESIGAYCAPVYHRSPLEKIGPFGDYFLNKWDDGKHNGVKQIVLRYGLVIDGVSFNYVDRSNGSTVEGKLRGNRGPVVEVFDLDYPTEYLVGMCGYFGIFGKFPCIRSLTFETNLNRKFGPCGSQEGKYFSFKSNTAEIVGFHGSINFYLNSIGPYVRVL